MSFSSPNFTFDNLDAGILSPVIVDWYDYVPKKPVTDFSSRDRINALLDEKSKDSKVTDSDCFHHIVEESLHPSIRMSIRERIKKMLKNI